MSAPGNANARLQPGVRAIKLTDAPTLRRCVRHVNGSYGEAELRTEKARRALREFAKIVTEARKVFAAPGGVGSASGVRAWLVFYEAKQSAYADLRDAVPQVPGIQDFWRYVQNMPVTQWLPIIEAEGEHITLNRSLCEDCGTVEGSWPTPRRCEECEKARRRKTYRNAKERKRIREQARKCAVCQVEPVGSRQRVCFKYKANVRRERNRRYQKSLKQRNLRRGQPDFTREESSTVSALRISRCPARSVEDEAVLTVGLGMSAGHGDLHAANRPEYSTLEATR
jgi:hypothetical protein